MSDLTIERVRELFEFGEWPRVHSAGMIHVALTELDRLQAQVEELEKALKSSPECWHFNNEGREEFMERYWAWRSAALEGKK